jgi:small-conductance mechanosensitive channel
METTEPLLMKLWSDLHYVSVLWQAGVFAASVALALLIWYALRPRIARHTSEAKWGPALKELRRLVVPPLVLAFLLVGRWALARYDTVALLDIAVPLTLSLAIVRLLFHVLGLVFAPGAALYAFERTFAWLIWLGVALHILGLAPGVLRFFSDITFQVGKQQVSLLLIGQAVVWIVVALLLALWLGRLLEERLMAASAFDISLRVMLTKLVRAALLLLAVLLVLPALGIDLTALSVFGGALGVGIGFGLQKIASNYLSGFIILFDRSVKIGDLITVDNRTGQLAQMTARYVVVRGLDGTEAIIPNDTLITSTVVNHSYTERLVAVSVQTLIDYSSDVELALKIMVDIARAHPRVLPKPEPGSSIKSFDDSGIHLQLGVWIDDPEKGHGNLCSDLYLSILREFKARGIRIPPPQREVRLVRESSPVTGA